MSDLLSRLTADRLEELAREQREIAKRCDEMGIAHHALELAAICEALAGAERAIVAGERVDLRGRFGHMIARDGLAVWTDAAASWTQHPTLLAALAAVAEQEKSIPTREEEKR